MRVPLCQQGDSPLAYVEAPQVLEEWTSGNHIECFTDIKKELQSTTGLKTRAASQSLLDTTTLIGNHCTDSITVNGNPPDGIKRRAAHDVGILWRPNQERCDVS